MLQQQTFGNVAPRFSWFKT